MKHFIFAKVPRTASETMSAVFEDQHPDYVRCGDVETATRLHRNEKMWGSVCYNHLPVAYLKKENIVTDAFLADRVKFSFVRNPFDRLVSYWRLKSGEAIRAPILKDCKTFSDFVHKLYYKKSYVPNFRCGGYNLVEPQWRWIPPWFDFVGSYERLHEDFAVLCEMIGHSMKIDRRVSFHPDTSEQRKHYTEYYDNKTEQLVSHIYKDDFMAFGYTGLGCQEPYDSKTILKNLRKTWKVAVK